MVKASRHRPVGSFLTRSRATARPALEALEVRLAPAMYTVDRPGDLINDGSGLTGSLRYCLDQTNKNPGADTISIATTQPIVLTSQLQITDAVTITGGSGLSLIERDSMNPTTFGLFAITASAGNVTLENLELTGGDAPSTGGAVSNAADLTLQNCWIHDNTAGETGGGVYTAGNYTSAPLTVTDCTFQANSVAAGGDGGGVSVDSMGATFTGTTFEGNTADSGGGVYLQAYSQIVTLDFSNCTFSGNKATSGGGEGGALATYAGEAQITADFLDCTLAGNTSFDVGGVFAYSAGGKTKFTYEGSLFADNSVASLGGQGTQGIDYTLASLGHNLSTDGRGMSAADVTPSAPGIGSLGYYGGPTPTIPLLAGSPALEAGTTIAGITTDQRGVARPQGSAPDIGAFEARPGSLVLDTSDAFANVGVAFSRGGSITGGDGVTTACVDYGDSASADGGASSLGSGPDFTLSHAYSAEGTYTVTVTLYDGGVLLDTKQLQVDVFLDGVPTDGIHEGTTSGPGVATVNATDPGDGSSVTASLLHLAPTNSSLLVAIVPNSVAAALNGSSQIAGNTITSAYEVRAVNVGVDDQITVVFHYFNNDFAQPVLRYYNRNTGQEGVVETDTYIVDPVTKTITLVLDSGSTPGILDISGTVFTIAVPLAVSVTPVLDPTTASALANGGGGFVTGFATASGEGGAGAGASAAASFQVTGSQTFVVVASFTALTSPFSDDSAGGRSLAPDRANLLADLPVVPDSLITLPGPILTPGSAEMPIPAEPPKATTPAKGATPPTSRLDDSGGGAPDEAFARFDDGRLALRLYSLPCWAVEGEAGDAPADWRDTSLAIAAFVAARPAGPRRRPSANAPPAR